VAEDDDLVKAEFNRAFVLMQYIGYLRRNPNDAPDSDYTGYDFWLTKLNNFKGDFVKAEMVKAFITSIEYRGRFQGGLAAANSGGARASLSGTPTSLGSLARTLYFSLAPPLAQAFISG
jgi:hypothetical protein